MNLAHIGNPTQYCIYEDSLKILKKKFGLDIPTQRINLEFLSREEFDKKYEGSALNVWGISETPCAELYLHSVRSEGAVVGGTTELIDSCGKRAYKIEVPVDEGNDNLFYRAKLIGNLCCELTHVWMWENNVVGLKYRGLLQENHNYGKIIEEKSCQMNKILDDIQKIDELIYMRYPFVTTADAFKDFCEVASLVQLAARSASYSLNLS
ncbi:MAG: hypothetical protein KAT43_05110 [Nanoarchaeota archaeon]|nr:hypothetical protein [Nanoarchaeota archaeon]